MSADRAATDCCSRRIEDIRVSDTILGQRRHGDREQRQDRPTDEADVRRPNDEVPADRREDRDPDRRDREDEPQERKDRRHS